jgi:TolB-like protein
LRLRRETAANRGRGFRAPAKRRIREGILSFLGELKRRNVVRVGVAYAIIGWILVQVGEAVFPAFEVPDAILRGLVIVLILGLPAVLVFAWVFEITPEGIKREKDIDRAASITGVTGRKLDRLIITTLSIAVVLLLVDRFVTRAPESDPPTATAEVTRPEPVAGPSQAQAEAEPSIAVLPFVNMSDDPSNEYFSDGISEELLNVLVKVSGIKVASRTSSFAFKGKDVSIPEIAEELHVDHVLEGSVRKSGNRVRVTAQLIEVRSDRHLWSETYDRELEDIFAIQDEISGHIVDALKVALGAGEAQAIADAGKPTENLEAYELYLQGRYFWQRRGEQNIKKAIDLLKRSLDADPAFARAWAGLAAAYITLPVYSTEPWQEYFPMARQAAERALALDDTLADAYVVVADITRMVDLEWQGAERAYLAALEYEPRNATAHLWYAEFLFVVGRLEDALEHNEIAYELDPLSPGANINLAWNLMALGRPEDALRFARAGAELGHPVGEFQQGIIAMDRGDYEQALARFEAGDLKAGQGPGFPGEGMIEKLRDEGSAAAVDYVMSISEDYPPQRTLGALVVVGGGERAARFALDHINELGGNDWFTVWRAQAGPMRASPEFQEIVTRLGLIDYWRATGWPDLCQPEGDGIACR